MNTFITNKNLERRFWSKVDKGAIEECWNWTGAKQTKGYGSFGVGPGKTQLAHRVAYMLKEGPIPRGLVIMHICDNRLCCNPRHLKVGTIADNNHDAISKGRNAIGERNGNSKLTEEQVKDIRKLYGTGDYTNRQLAQMYKMSDSAIYSITKNKYWKLPLAG
ncbi:MAG: HNH endonuclease [Anaerolineales bacterium]|nr:HNH endonuclease [Anaerolineales bacterium]MBX3004717.1 HNH endonuclease [Anaerolineales bacterium]